MGLNQIYLERIKWLPENDKIKNIKSFKTPPANEVKFKFLEGRKYQRALWKHDLTSHIINVTEYDHKQFYQDDWVTSTYTNIEGIRNTFERIINYPYQESDNKHRVERVSSYCIKAKKNKSRTLLDIGSGLAVFAYEMQKKGWDITVCEPDKRLIKFAKDYIGICGISEGFLELDIQRNFELITLNKVLEHIEEPELFLIKCKSILSNTGIIYLEVPDSINAELSGYEREEFFIDHMHIFSMLSLNYLTKYCDLKILKMERIIEPSGKFTICAFLEKI